MWLETVSERLADKPLGQLTSEPGRCCFDWLTQFEERDTSEERGPPAHHLRTADAAQRKT